MSANAPVIVPVVTRAWLVSVNGPDFRLLKGEDALSQYNFNSNRINHMFCKNCGIKSFALFRDQNILEVHSVNYFVVRITQQFEFCFVDLFEHTAVVE